MEEIYDWARRQGYKPGYLLDQNCKFKQVVTWGQYLAIESNSYPSPTIDLYDEGVFVGAFKSASEIINRAKK